MSKTKRRALAQVLVLCVFLTLSPTGVTLANGPQVTLEYLGHSAFILDSGGDRLVTDPGVWASPYDLSADGIDVAVISHWHSDHFYPEAVKTVTSKVYGLTQEGDFVNIAGAVYGAFTLTDVLTSHGAPLPGMTPQPNTAFIIETAGIRIVHLGDAFGSMADDRLASKASELKGPQGIDILMIPVGDSMGGMVDYATVKEVIAVLAPKVVIPIHAWTHHREFIEAAKADHMTVVQKIPIETFSADSLPTQGVPVVWDMAESMVQPFISSVEPSHVVAGVSTPITIRGNGFLPNATVELIDPATQTTERTFNVPNCSSEEINITLPPDLQNGFGQKTYDVGIVFPSQPPYRATSAYKGSAITVCEDMPPMWTDLSVQGSTLTLTFSENIKTLDPITNTQMTPDDLAIRVDGSPDALVEDKIGAISTANLDSNQITIDLLVTPNTSVQIELLGVNHVIDSAGQTLVGQNLRTWTAAPNPPPNPPSGDENKAPSVVGSIYADGQAVADLNAFFMWDPNTKLAQLQIQKSGSLDINSPYDSGTVFTLKVNNGEYNPFIVLGAGEIQGWSVSQGITTITVKGVHFKPDDSHDFALSVALAVQFDPGQDMMPAEYNGMYISTNGNQFMPPQKDPAGRFAMQVGGADGVKDGFFQAFLPQALLTAWGVTGEDQLQAFIGDAQGQNERQVPAPSVRSVPGGMIIRFDMEFSLHKVFIAADTTPPSVESQSPSNTATGVQRDVTIQFTFSENIQPGVGFDGIVLKDAHDNACAITKSIQGNCLDVKTSGNLNYSTTYTLILPAGAVRDAAGNNLAAGTSLTFTTENAPSQPPSHEEPAAPPATAPSPEIPVEDGQADLSGLVDATTTRNPDGTTAAEVDIDGKTIETALGKNDVNQLVVKMDGTENDKVVRLPASAFAKMAKKGAELSLRTREIAINIPVTAVNMDKIAEQLGDVAQNAKVEVTIREVPRIRATELKNAASLLDSALTPLGRIFDLNLELTWGTSKMVIDSFGKKTVEGQIPLEKAVLDRVLDTRKVSVFKYHEATGLWLAVPTRVDPVSGLLTFFTNTLSKYMVMECHKTFTDIQNHWAKDDVEVMASKMIVRGVTATEFLPEKAVSRAEFAAMLVRALGLKEKTESQLESEANFDDVKPGHWFYGGVISAAEAGIVKGALGSFKPLEPISRQEMAIMAVRALEYTGKAAAIIDREQEALISRFIDSDLVAPWAAPEMAQAIKMGLIKGTSTGYLAPENPATRAQAVTLIRRLLEQAGW